MLNFTFYNPAKIYFGAGQEAKVGEYVAQYSKKILLHYGGGSIKKNGIYQKVADSLRKSGVAFVELGGVQPNPRLSLVRKGMQLCKEHGLNFILAVGGGSVIDSAKGIAVGVCEQEDIWDYYMGGSDRITQALPIGVVLTIPATGSESSPSSVITNEENDMKRSIATPHVIPKFAVLNPEFTYTLPPYQIACGASDILSHLMERYFTQVDHVDFTDRLLEASMRTILDHGVLALEHPEDYHARAEMMWVGTVAHNGLLNTGRIGDWASHHIEHELSGIYDIAHGAGLAIVTPAWMKYVCHANMDRFVQFATRVFDVSYPMAEKESIVREGILRLEAWYRRMGLPIRLSEVGIGRDRFAEMAGKCMIGRSREGNFQKLDQEDIIKIYELAL